MPLSEKEELELLELKRKRSGKKAISAPAETKKPLMGSSGSFEDTRPLLERAGITQEKPSLLETFGEFGKGVVKGFGEATSQGTAALGAGLISSLSLLPGDMPPTNPIKVYKMLREEGKKQPIHQSLEAKTAPERIGKYVGETGTKIAAGGGLSGGIMKGSSGLLPTITRGAVANIPFLPEVAGESGATGLGVDVAFDAALNTFLHGAGRVVRPPLENIVKRGISKGVKPTVIGKPSLAKMDKFYNNAKTAVETIAGNKNSLNILDDAGDAVALPETAAQMAQAVDQTKKLIYQKYHNMALSAGDAGAVFNVDNIVKNLDEIISGPKNKKYSPQVRKYAESLKDEIAELAGEAPEIIEERIKDLNSSLASYFDGRVTKAKARIDASVAAAMREELDKNIIDVLGTGYQQLKKQYGALKAIEKEVNKRALVNARGANKSLLDFTDIFTGGELVSGLLTMNPVVIAKSATQKGIKETFKMLNNPDRAIKQMFQAAYNISEQGTKKQLPPLSKYGAASVVSETATKPLKEDEQTTIPGRDKIPLYGGRRF